MQPVPWMSGLVSGLQNRVRRFESARYLKELQLTEALFLSIGNMGSVAKKVWVNLEF